MYRGVDLSTRLPGAAQHVVSGVVSVTSQIRDEGGIMIPSSSGCAPAYCGEQSSGAKGKAEAQ
jgi:hypothetical protein